MQFLKITPKKVSVVAIFILMAFLSMSGLSNAVQANGLTANEQEAVRLLNKDRAAHGLSPLKVDMRLVVLGRQHAADMIRRNYFSHTNPDGQTPFDRMKKAGVSYRTAGENIAMDYSVKSAQESWMQSPGHRKNILSKNYTHVGIGVAKKSDGTLYLVQVFIGV